MSAVGAVVRDHRFRWLLGARCTSVAGSTLAPIALAFAVLQRDPQAGLGPMAGALGLVMIARMLALVVFALWGGVLADRLSRRRTMVISDLAAGGSQALLAVLVITGHASLSVLAVLTFVSAGAAAVFGPASDGMLPLILPREALKDAQAVLTMGIGAARIVGAGSAGLLIAGLGAGGALLVDACTFLASAAMLALVAVPPHERPVVRSVLDDLRQGWREFVSRQWAWVTVAQVGVMNFFLAGGLFVLGPIIAQESLGGPYAWSLIIAAQALGFLAGSTLALRLRVERAVLVGVIATVCYAPPFFLLAVQAPLWAVAAAMFLEGMAIDFFGVLWMSVFLTRVPEESMSRVGSYDQISSMALVPLGFAAVAPIAAHWGTRTTLIGYGVLMLLCTAAALLSNDVRRVTAGLATSAAETSERAAGSPEPVAGKGVSGQAVAGQGAAASARSPLPGNGSRQPAR